MGRVMRPFYTKAGKDGKRVRVRVKNWYAEWTDAAGATRRRKIGPDKRLAESALARLQEQVTREKFGLPDPRGQHAARSRPLAELFAEYGEVLEARDTSEAYRKNTAASLKAVAEGCGWSAWPDVTADGLVVFLGKLRDRKEKPPGLSRLNGHIRTWKAFCNWHCESLGVVSPLRKVKPYPEKTDRRRSKRILTDAELGKLLAATAAAPKRTNTKIPPPDRAALYRVAAYTGLRASELASLYPAAFRLDAEPPVVVVEARDAKGKREEPIPLPGHLVEFLRGWLAGRDPKERLWPGKWADQKGQVKWLKRDAKRAGLGKGVMLHGLKRKYVTGLIRTGADIDEVRRLARHKHLNTTLEYYAGSDLPGLKKAADRLPPPE